MTIGLFIIALVIIVGGSLAYLGNQFGRQVGRRKISFMGLRPRYTSMLITIMIGMFISFFTVTIVAIYSQKAKVALIGVQELQAKKKKLRYEIEELNRSSHRSSALFQLNEPIVLGVVRGDAGAGEKERALKKILSLAQEQAQKKNEEQAAFLKTGMIKKEQIKNLVTYDEKEYARILDELIRDSSVVLLFSKNNTFFGEPLNVGFSVYPDVRLYKKGDTLLSTHIKADDEEEKIFFELLAFLKEMEQKAEQKGMLRVPRAKSIIDLSMADISTALQQIRSYKGWVEISAYALDDLYTSGPLTVKLTITP
jgi:hypothetical protein